MGSSSTLWSQGGSTDHHGIHPRHRIFVDEYVANGLRGTAAARAIGYKNPSETACKLLKRPEVIQYLNHHLEEIQRRQLFRREELLARMRRLNDFNLMHAVANLGDGMLEISPRRVREVADEIGECVTDVQIVTQVLNRGTVTRVRIKLMDKDRMFDRELKYHGLLDFGSKVTASGEEQHTFGVGRLAVPPTDPDPVEARISHESCG